MLTFQFESIRTFCSTSNAYMKIMQLINPLRKRSRRNVCSYLDDREISCFGTLNCYSHVHKIP
jgi:hypothetical protein